MKESEAIKELDSELVEEINKHKYIESQKVGYDLNGIAISGWFARHYEAWLAWQKFKILNKFK